MDIMNPVDMNLLRQTKALPKPNTNGVATAEQAERMARDISAHFFSHFLDQMTQALNEDNEFSGGQGEQIFRGFFNEEAGKQMAQTMNASQLPVSVEMMTKILDIKGGQNDQSK